jgi:flagellar biosynthetic protein FlhB
VADEDDASKTEEPTERRLEKSREDGETAVSQEVKTWAMLTCATLLVVMAVPTLAKSTMTLGAFFLDHADSLDVDVLSAQSAVTDSLRAVGWSLAPFFLFLVVVAMGAGLVQSGLIWAPKKIAPDFKRISLGSGLKRVFGSQALVEFIKGIFKIALVAGLGVAVSIPWIRDLELLPAITTLGALDRSFDMAVALMAAAVGAMTFIAAADYAYQRYSHHKKMLMTRQQVRDEHKQSEGDPHIKARIRQLRMERSQQRMMAAVPDADVVITNPTHFAVALKYDMEKMAAPRVVAKGADFLAKRIRELAAEHGIVVMENPPLARALYATVDLDSEIPTEHYKAVAEVIGYVMNLKQKAGKA